MMAKYRFEQIAFNSTEKKKPTEEDKFTYLGLEHLDSGSLKVTRFGSDVAPIGEKLVMRKGDVLFGKRRAYQKKVAIAPFDGVFSAHGMVLRPREEVVDARFFPLFISSDYFLDAAIKISVGSLSPTINWRDLKDLEFELPPLEEQRRLAAVLWAINETIESYKILIKKTDELVKSQFIEMFGTKETAPLSEFATICAGQSAPSDEEYSETGTPFIKAGNLENLKLGIIEETDCHLVSEETIAKRKLKIQKVGSVLVAKSGMSCLSGHIYALKRDAYVVSHLACIRAKDDAYVEMVKWHFIITGTQGLIKNPSYPAIQIPQFENMHFPRASKAEAETFAAFAIQSDKSKFAVRKLSNLNLSGPLPIRI